MTIVLAFILGAMLSIGLALLLMLFATLYIDHRLRPEQPEKPKRLSRREREWAEEERLTRPLPPIREVYRPGVMTGTSSPVGTFQQRDEPRGRRAL